uniref:Uncharacterized protein n=1 Tax=Anopheles atroparvus TaxID=41427 RepID=A0AAG5DSM1_ANOAO
MDENEVMAAFLWSKQSQEMYSNQGLKDLHHLHQDFIINDYTDKIATNIDLLDTELKFAWAALNLLNEEYTKMSEKVFKLQSLNISQQRIVQNLQFMEENRKAYLDMIPDYAKHHEFSLQEQSRLRKDLEYRDRINEALMNSGMIPLQEEQEEFLHRHQLQQEQQHQEHLFRQQLASSAHLYRGMYDSKHELEQQQRLQLQQAQQQQAQMQFDNEFLLLQRNLASVPEVLQEQYASLVPQGAGPPLHKALLESTGGATLLGRAGGPHQTPEMVRLSTNPFLSAGEADRGLLRNIEPADSAAIIEEQLRTSFLNHAKQIELEFGTPKSKRFSAERIEKMQSEEVRELINKIMSEEDVASLSSEEMDKVRCFMAKNCSELMDVFDDELQQVVYPVKTAELLLARHKQAPGVSPRKELLAVGLPKYLPEGLATLTKDDLLTVENGTITIQDSASESDFRLNLNTTPQDGTMVVADGSSPKKLIEFSPFGLQSTGMMAAGEMAARTEAAASGASEHNGVQTVQAKQSQAQADMHEPGHLHAEAEAMYAEAASRRASTSKQPTGTAMDEPKTTIPPTFACSNLVGLTNGKPLYPGMRPNITEALEMTTCVTSQSLPQAASIVETVDARRPASGICSETAVPSGSSATSSRKASVTEAAAKPTVTDTSDTAAIIQAIISRRSSVAEPSTSPPTFQPLPGQTSITDSPEMQAIYDSLSRKSSIPTLSDTLFFPSLDITDSGFADTTSDSLALFSQLPLTVPAGEAPVSLPDFSTMSAISNMPDNSDCSSFLHMSMNSSGISEASDSIAFGQPMLAGGDQPPKDTLAPSLTGKLSVLPPIVATATPTLTALAEGKPIAEATAPQAAPATSVTVTTTTTVGVKGMAAGKPKLATVAAPVTTVVPSNAKVAVVAVVAEREPLPTSAAAAPKVPSSLPVANQVGSQHPQAKPPPSGAAGTAKQPPTQPPNAQMEPKGGFFQATGVNLGSFFNKVNKNLAHQESTDSTIGTKSKSFFASMKSSFSLDSSKASVDEAEPAQAGASGPPINSAAPQHPDSSQAQLSELSPGVGREHTSSAEVSPGNEQAYHEPVFESHPMPGQNQAQLPPEQQPSPPRETDGASYEHSPTMPQQSPMLEQAGDEPFDGELTYNGSIAEEYGPNGALAEPPVALEKEVDPAGSAHQRRQSLFRTQGSEDGEGGSKWKLLKTLKEKRIEEKQKVVEVGESFDDEPGLFKKVDVSGKNEEPEKRNGTVDSGRNNGLGDNTFYSNIDSMPDIRPRRKSIPLVSELVSVASSVRAEGYIPWFEPFP